MRNWGGKSIRHDRWEHGTLTVNFDITVESAKRFSAEQELVLARTAFKHKSASRQARSRLATLLNIVDAFGETIELLSPAGDLSFAETMMLVQAYLAAETDAGNREARSLARKGVALAETELARASALAELGKTQARLGDPAALNSLREALALDPANKNACKRLAAWHFERGQDSEVLDFASALSREGVWHSRLSAAQVLALARMGRIDEARAVDAREALGLRRPLPVPHGYADIETFNADLTTQLLSHPALRFERYGTASEETWRIDNPMSAHAPLVGDLLAGIRATIADHAGSLAGFDHSWVRARPKSGTLHCWSVITEGDGYETWHVHQFGWLSGTYYLQVPQGITDGSGEGGCLAFGLPEDIVGEDAANAFGRELVRPEAGVVTLFPSHSYHRTFSHNLMEQRICIAFDLLLG